MSDILPPDKFTNREEEVWIRLTVFLSLKAPITQSAYSYIFKEWCAFINATLGTPDGSKKILAATDIHAAAYRLWLHKQRGNRPRVPGVGHMLSNATVAKKLSILRRIYRVFIAHDLGIAKNPFDSDVVPLPSIHDSLKRPTEMIEYEKIFDIISMPDLSLPNGRGVRDRAILSILFATGMRRGELRALRIADYQKSNAGTPYFYLRGTKAKKDLKRSIAPWAIAMIEELIRYRIYEQGAEAGDYLCIGYIGRNGTKPIKNRISAQGIYNLFRDYCQEAGVKAHATPHSARATAITYLLDLGYSHREVQQFSGHASVRMVEHYDKKRRTVDENPAQFLSYESLTKKPS